MSALFLLFFIVTFSYPLDAEEFPPKLLSEVGIFQDLGDQIINPELVPYTVNSPFWSDGTYKTRFMWLPIGEQIAFSPDQAWEFPQHTILIKNFYLEIVRGDPNTRKIIETRLMVKNGRNDSWNGYSYQWNTEGTEAYLLSGSSTQTFVIDNPADPVAGFLLQDYYYPSGNDCLSCHTKAAGRVLGLRTSQLNRIMDGEQNQLRMLEEANIFRVDLPNELNELPKLPNPFDEQKSLQERARSYLATNCSQCHRPQSVSRTILDLRYDTKLSETNTVNAYPTLGALGSTDARIIAPGAASNSTIYLRMLSLDSFRMPSIGSTAIDIRGSRLIAQWITTMGVPTTVSDVKKSAHNVIDLSLNYPNPFNSATNINFQISEIGQTILSIHNIGGKNVRTLVDTELTPGRYHFLWDGRTDDGINVSSGVYFYRLQTEQFKINRRLSLIR